MAIRRRVAARLVLVGLALGLAACDAISARPDPSLRVTGFGGDWLYPGPATDCADIERCDDLLAEIERWVSANRPGALPTQAVTFHSAVSDDGDNILLNRSGGPTWIAVVRFADGSRSAVMVGCGVGISPERCFSHQ